MFCTVKCACSTQYIIQFSVDYSNMFLLKGARKGGFPVTLTYRYSLLYSTVYSTVYIIVYSVHNSVQCTVQISVQYNICLLGVQMLVG